LLSKILIEEDGLSILTNHEQSQHLVRALLDHVRDVCEPDSKSLTDFQERRLYVTKGGLIVRDEPHIRIGDLVCALNGFFLPILVKKNT